MAYAAQTTVSAERSKMEIEALVKKYGADQFYSGWGESTAIVGFSMHGRMVKFRLPVPDKNDSKYRQTSAGRNRSVGKRGDALAEKAHDQDVRQRWRALLLVVKAKLEAVESGITTFEQEFLAHIVMANGKTVADWALPQLAEMYTSGKMPALLPGIGETSAED